MVNRMGGGGRPVRSCVDPPVKGKEVMRDTYVALILSDGIFHAGHVT